MFQRCLYPTIGPAVFILGADPPDTLCGGVLPRRSMQHCFSSKTVLGRDAHPWEMTGQESICGAERMREQCVCALKGPGQRDTLT